MMNFKIYFMKKRLLFLLPYLICVIAGLGLGYCVFEVDRGKAKHLKLIVVKLNIKQLKSLQMKVKYTRNCILNVQLNMVMYPKSVY